MKFYEKGDRPLEFVTTRQWFVRILEHKEELLQAGDRISWHPDFMRHALPQLDGEPPARLVREPAALLRRALPGLVRGEGRRGDRLRAAPSSPDPKALPVDPTSDAPPGLSPRRSATLPGGFRAETDVFDTWFTSSLTPQIASGWTDEPARHAKLFPMDLRPQSHEIIRTWAFYTIVKAHLHEGDDPLAARRHLGLGPRPRPQEDVQEQGQRDHAHAPPRPVRRRRRALLVAAPPAWAPTPPSTRRS